MKKKLKIGDQVIITKSREDSTWDSVGGVGILTKMYKMSDGSMEYFVQFPDTSGTTVKGVLPCKTNLYKECKPIFVNYKAGEITLDAAIAELFRLTQYLQKLI